MNDKEKFNVAFSDFLKTKPVLYKEDYKKVAFSLENNNCFIVRYTDAIAFDTAKEVDKIKCTSITDIAAAYVWAINY